jgi:anaerobic magnesium-protoporphyrin IX monomethyl ester cyclase
MKKIKDKSEFRVLIVYPNLPLMLVPSLAISIFTRIFKDQGYRVELFDCTPYVLDPEESSSPENRVKFSQARDFDYESDLGVEPNFGDPGVDFRDLVLDFKPDFIIYSVVEDAFRQSLHLLESIADQDIPHLVGGVFPTAAPDRCMDFDAIKMIGLGEGERTVVEVAERVRKGEPLVGIPGTWCRGDEGKIVKTPQGPLININGARPDFSLFDERRFYRPMGGRIFKTMPIESYRGCPYACTFCNSPMQREFAKDAGQGNFLRRKTMENLRDELREVIDHYDPEFLYFIDDSFLARPRKEIFAFCDMYEEFGRPFWFNTRPENCDADIMKRLKEIGVYRISFGVECGNDEYRRKVLRRYVSNEKIIKSFDTISDSGVSFSVNLIIGFPGETRDLIMDTVELARSIRGYDTITVSIFTPYHGTRLRSVAEANNWMDPGIITKHTTSSSILRMPPPYVSADDIDGLMRVLPLYCYFPKSDWDDIRRAETNDKLGNEILARYQDAYQDEFLKLTQDDKKATLVEGGTGCRVNPKDAFRVSPSRLGNEQYMALTVD